MPPDASLVGGFFSGFDFGFSVLRGEMEGFGGCCFVIHFGDWIEKLVLFCGYVGVRRFEQGELLFEGGEFFVAVEFVFQRIAGGVGGDLGFGEFDFPAFEGVLEFFAGEVGMLAADFHGLGAAGSGTESTFAKLEVVDLALQFANVGFDVVG